MCNWKTEGTKHGCGHYKITRKIEKRDCNSRRCVYSSSHVRPCPDCNCEKFYGPDIEETVTRVTPEYCDHCNYWYKQVGRRPS